MVDNVYNIAKGRARTYHDNVENNAPAGSVLRVMMFVSTVITDDVRRDVDTIAAFDALSTTTEFVGSGYTAGGISQAAAALSFLQDDTTNNSWDGIMTDVTWGSVAAGNGPVTHLVVAYDSGGASTRANMVPVSIHDFAVTPNGGDITAQFNAAGYVRAS